MTNLFDIYMEKTIQETFSQHMKKMQLHNANHSNIGGGTGETRRERSLNKSKVVRGAMALHN